MKVLAVDHCCKRADQQGTDLHAAAGLGFDDPLYRARQNRKSWRTPR
jgi:hypothetical protein